MIKFVYINVKKNIFSNKINNLLFVCIITLSLILFDTGVIYQDSHDNYRINKNPAQTDVLTCQVITNEQEIKSYIQNSAIRHFETHSCCSMKGIHDRFKSLVITDNTLIDATLRDKGINVDGLSEGQVIINSDLKEELLSLCTSQIRENREYIVAEKNGVSYELEIIEEISFSNPYFMTDRILFIMNMETMSDYCSVWNTEIQESIFFNLKDLTGDAVENYFGKFHKTFEESGLRYNTYQNQSSIGYESLLFQDGQNIMILVMAAISFGFALVAIYSGFSLKNQTMKNDTAVYKKLGVRNGLIAASLVTEYLIFFIISAIIAGAISYFLMWLALDKINFIMSSNMLSVNIGFSWRLIIKTILFNTVAFIICILPIIIRLFTSSPVEYSSEKLFYGYVPRSSSIYIKSKRFTKGFAWILFIREKKVNLFQTLMTALPLINIVLLMMIDMRNVAQETVELELYYTAMWDLAIIMSWLRSIACILTVGIFTLLYNQSKAKEIDAFNKLGIMPQIVYKAYAIRNIVVMSIGTLIASIASYGYYSYTKVSAEKYALDVGYHFPVIGVLVYISFIIVIYIVLGRKNLFNK